MKLKSKIRLFTTALLVCILLVISATIYFLFVKTATELEITALEREAQSIGKSVEWDDIEDDEIDDIAKAIGRHIPEDGMIRVLDGQFRVLATASDEGGWETLPPLTMGEGSTTRQYGGSQIAVVHYAITFEDGPAGIIELTSNLDGIQQNAQVLLYVLLVTTLLALLLSLISGGVLAKIILRPITALIGTMEDIRRKGIFKKIPIKKKTKDELYQMTVTFNEMIDQLQENFDKQQQFVSDASHELSTPLTVIESYATLLKRWGMSDPDTRAEAVEAIYTEAVRMKGMTEQFLSLASEERGGNLNLEKIELVSLCQQVAKWIKEVHKRNIKIIPQVKEVLVTADEQKMKQVLFILLDNAIKYSSDQVEVRVGVDGSTPYFSVHDYGEGIPHSEIKHVFERFHRVDKARTRRTGGTGLGLSIAQTIVQAHGGTIEVDSVEGVGTTFTVRLSGETVKERQ